MYANSQKVGKADHRTSEPLKEEKETSKSALAKRDHKLYLTFHIYACFTTNKVIIIPPNSVVSGVSPNSLKESEPLVLGKRRRFGELPSSFPIQ